MDVNVLSQGRQNLYGSVQDNIISNSNSNSNDLITANTANTANINNNTNDNTTNTNNKNTDGISTEDAKKVADKMNKLLEDKNTHVEYEQDEKLKNVMIMKVIDNASNKVVNQIPSKQALDMISDFCDIIGLLVDKRS